MRKLSDFDKKIIQKKRNQRVNYYNMKRERNTFGFFVLVNLLTIPLHIYAYIIPTFDMDTYLFDREFWSFFVYGMLPLIIVYHFAYQYVKKRYEIDRLVYVILNLIVVGIYAYYYYMVVGGI